MTPLRPVPGIQRRCRRCGLTVVFAITAASPTGSGGKWQPFDPLEDPNGNVGVRPTARGRAVARALGKDDTLDREAEILAMPHAATCQPVLPDDVWESAKVDSGNVIDLATRRAQKRRRT